MREVKSENFKHNDRVELSAYFDVHAHGNGFQLRRDDRTYSIIPVPEDYNIEGVKEIGWEVNNDRHRFGELHKAIEYVLEEENVSAKVEPIMEYYGKEEADK